MLSWTLFFTFFIVPMGFNYGCTIWQKNPSCCVPLPPFPPISPPPLTLPPPTHVPPPPRTSGDVINAMNYSLTFDDNNGFTSGGANASPNKSLTDTISSPLEDKPSSELFEKMCSTNLLQQFQDLSSMWEGKEKCITFSSDGPLDTKRWVACSPVFILKFFK